MDLPVTRKQLFWLVTGAVLIYLLAEALQHRLLHSPMDMWLRLFLATF